MTRAARIVWLSRVQVEAFNEDQMRQHGGLAGLRDSEALEAALARPVNMSLYDGADLPALAAAYAHGIVKNHPFLDGNKRPALTAAGAFLDMNGIELNLDEEQAATLIRGLATGEIDQKKLTAVFQDN